MDWPKSFFGLVIGLGLASGPAAADSTYCQLHYAPGTAGFATAVASGIWLCADAGTTGGVGWGSNVVQPDAGDAGLVSASQAGSAGGVFAAAASASSIAAPGRLRAQAFGEAIAPPPQDGFSFARGYGAANATIYEAGRLVSIGGGAPGAPVALRLSIDVHGGFSGSGDGDGELTVFRNGFVNFQRGIFLFSLSPSLSASHDLAGFQVGDTVAVFMRIRATAGGSNQPGAPTTSVADMSNTGEFFLDVRSNNAAFDSTSGYDYRSVPEPDAAMLLAAGVVSIALRSGGRSARPGWARFLVRVDYAEGRKSGFGGCTLRPLDRGRDPRGDGRRPAWPDRALEAGRSRGSRSSRSSRTSAQSFAASSFAIPTQ